MCMEDVNLGRQSPYEEVVQVGDGSYHQILKPDPYRTAIIFNSSNAGDNFFTTSTNPVALQGIVLKAQVVSFALNVRDHGQLVTAGWFARNSGTGIITVMTARLMKGSPDGQS